jgi:hypothetical protein
MFVISADDALGHMALVDYVPDTEQREVVYTVRPQSTDCAYYSTVAKATFSDFDVCRH